MQIVAALSVSGPPFSMLISFSPMLHLFFFNLFSFSSPIFCFFRPLPVRQLPRQRGDKGGEGGGGGMRSSVTGAVGGVTSLAGAGGGQDGDDIVDLSFSRSALSFRRW